MPLEESGSDEAFERNVAEMIRAGHPRDQALAAAYSIKRKHGGDTAQKAMSGRFLILKAGAPKPLPDPPIPEPVYVPDPQQPPHPEPEPSPPIEMRMGSSDQLEAAQQFAKAGMPMKLVDPERPHVTHLVGSDLQDPGLWRHTELVDGEPWSDHEFDRAEAAFLSALRAGGLPAIKDTCSDAA